MAMLEARTGPLAGRFFPLEADQTVLGRLPFCDIVLDTKTVSRQHARIVRIGDEFYVEDLQSVNGTFVNKQRVTGRTRLLDQDRIHLFDVLLVFHQEAPAAGEPAAEGQGPAPSAEPSSPRPAAVVRAAEAVEEQPGGVSAQTKLRAVLRITAELGSSLSLDQVLPKLLENLFEIFPQAQEGHILLAEGPHGELLPRALKQGRGPETPADTFRPISRSLAQRVMAERQAVLIVDTDDDQAADLAASVLQTSARSMMCAPLLGPLRQAVGVVQIEGGDVGKPFTRDDLELLATLAMAAGHAVEFVHAYESQLKLKLRERELATARQMQLRLLPQRRPAAPGYRFFDYYRAADAVGGDYLGYILLDDGRVALALGDVAGKGVSAALMMAQLSAEVRYRVATAATAAEALTLLNEEISPLDRFVTMVLCVLDPQRHSLVVASAGHMAPLRRQHAGRVLDEVGFAAGGPPLGVMPGWRYGQAQIELAPGDVVVAYTDGITEAQNGRHEVYGTVRLRHAVVRGPQDAGDLGQAILQDVERFTAGQPAADDVCLVCIGRDL